ncbi:MAG: hypothetical protein AAGI38_21860 [Bacteroidota bacterium]
MKRYCHHLSCFLCLLMGINGGFLLAQQAETLANSPDADINAYQRQSRQLIDVMAYMFNVMGDPEVPIQEKKIIFTESYLKLFDSEEVQIEDDLVEGRSVSVRKNVAAYLKDIDFFFKSASFEFIEESVSHQVTEQGELSFKFQLRRYLKAENLEGDSVNNEQLRFVELNVNRETETIKIVSVYTVNLGLEEELANWWNNLPPYWKKLWAPEVRVNDEVNFEQLWEQHPGAKVNDTLQTAEGDTMILNYEWIFRSLVTLTSKKSLDFSGNADLKDLEALSFFRELETLDISGTQVSDLTPLRNLTHLKEFLCDNSKVKSFEPISYATDLEVISCSGTPINTLQTLTPFKELKTLNCADTKIPNLMPVGQLPKLERLNCQRAGIRNLLGLEKSTALRSLDASHTLVTSIAPLTNLSGLKTLRLTGTPVMDIAPLAGMKGLDKVYLDSTQVKSLEPLAGLKNLKVAYLDGAKVALPSALEFMNQHPHVVIVCTSQELTTWWEGLSVSWKSVFKEQPVTAASTPENLHKLLAIDKVVISPAMGVTDLSPLSKMVNLKEVELAGVRIRSLEPLKDLKKIRLLNISNTYVTDLRPIGQLIELVQVDVSKTGVQSLAPLGALLKLTSIRADSTLVTELDSLGKMSSLDFLSLEGTKMGKNQAVAFMDLNPECLLMYRTEELNIWWNSLSPEWKKALKSVKGVGQLPAPESLHKLAGLTDLDLGVQQGLSDLGGLEAFIRLRGIHFTQTQIGNLRPLVKHRQLEVLDCPKNPIASLEMLQFMPTIKRLNCSNTAIVSLDFIEVLINLEFLDISGTLIDDVKPLGNTRTLKELYCFNTRVKNLKHIENIKGLKRLVCYNTRLTEKKVEDFKAAVPGCEVIFYGGK